MGGHRLVQVASYHLGHHKDRLAEVSVDQDSFVEITLGKVSFSHVSPRHLAKPKITIFCVDSQHVRLGQRRGLERAPGHIAIP